MEIQHFGIPTSDMDKTIDWYKALGFNVVYETVLDGPCRIAFIEVYDTLLEFYEAEVDCEEGYIHCLVFESDKLTGEYVGPSKEKLQFISSESNSLTYVKVLTKCKKDFMESLKIHGFSCDEDMATSGNVAFKVIESTNDLTVGPINHIAIDECQLKKRLAKLEKDGGTIVESTKYLPFFENGVIYSMTTINDELRLEYNQIIG